MQLYDHAQSSDWISGNEHGLVLTDTGRAAFSEFNIDYKPLEGARRPLCRVCLDWSMRRHHLAGGLGKAILQAMYTRGWAHRLPESHVVRFTPQGEQAFQSWLKT